MGVLHGHDVAIGNNWNGDGFLHCGDKPPVRPSIVTLGAGAAMNRHHLNAFFLGDTGQLRGVAVGLVPAGAHLQGDWDVHRPDRCLNDSGRQLFIPHQRRSGVAVHHFLHRTAHIDVDDGGAPFRVESRRRGHHFGIAAGELDRHGIFFRAVGGHFYSAVVAADHGLAGYHLGNYQAGAESFGKTPERKIADPRHGGQNHVVFQ